MTEYASADKLLADLGESAHIECGRETSIKLARAVRRRFATRRCAFALEADAGCPRDTVTSHLRFFSQLAGGAVHHEDAVAHFGLRGIARAKLRDLPASQAALVRLARASLFQPEVCLIERPLSDLDAEGRASALAWMSEAEERGCRFVTTLQPLREALLMPGIALWCEDGRFIEVAHDEDDSTAPPDGAFDEVRVCKIPAKADAATLLFDPREIDFIESANKQNHVSVRGSLYPTPLTMDELDERAFALRLLPLPPLLHRERAAGGEGGALHAQQLQPHAERREPHLPPALQGTRAGAARTAGPHARSPRGARDQ